MLFFKKTPIVKQGGLPYAKMNIKVKVKQNVLHCQSIINELNDGNLLVMLLDATAKTLS